MADHIYNGEYDWQVGDPITREKMNSIEGGIAEALEGLSDTNSDVSALSTRVTNAENSITPVREIAEQARSNANTALDGATKGSRAWEQITGVINWDEEHEQIVGNNLATIIQNAHNVGQTALDQIRAAKEVNTVVVNGREQTADSLAVKISYMDSRIDSAISTATDAINILQPVSGARDYTTRLTDIDANTVPEINLPDLITEIKNARGTNSNGGANTALVQRFTQDEARISQNETDIGNLQTNKVNVSDIVDNLNQSNTDKPLSANQGNVIKNMFGTGVGTGTGQTVVEKINTAQSNAETNAASYTDGRNTYYNVAEINNAHRSGLTDTNGDPVTDTLDNRFDDIEERLDAIDDNSTGTVAGLDSRLSAVETEIDNANGNSTLDARFDAVEDRATQLETDVSTIAGELHMVNTQTNAIQDTNTRIDTIEENVVAIGKEIGMLQDEASITDLSTSVSRTNTRVDEIEGEINDAHRTSNDTLDGRFDDIESAISHAVNVGNSDPGGLTERIAAVESDIETATTGIKARLTAAESDIDTLESDLNTASTGLKARVTALEDADTIIIPKERITYSEGVPTVYTANYVQGGTNTPITPSTTADYLFETEVGQTTKYFYWKYIDNNWELISGGGGGSGSSSGMFAATLADITVPDSNTDYFVGNNTIGYTHYRYIAPVVEGEEGTFVRILPKGLLINGGVNSNGGLVAYTVENGSDNVFSDFLAFKDVEATPVKDENDQVVATDLVFTDTNGTTHTARVQGGGGGGSTSSYSMRLNNTLSSLKLTVPKKDGYVANVKAKVVVKDAGVIDETFDQSHTINVVVQYRLSTSDPWTNFTTLTALNNTEFTVDVTSILTLGAKTYIQVKASTLIDEEEKISSLIYEVTQVEMSIAAIGFNPAIVRSSNFNFQYRCIGSGLTKQVHFLIDGTDVTGSPITTTLHNDIAQQAIPLAGLSSGMHSFQVYFTVGEISSNMLNYYILYNTDSSRVAPMIALAAENSTITYGDDLKINYTVSTVGTETTDEVVLELYTLDGSTETVLATQTFLDVENETVKEWRPINYPESGTAYIRATATHTVGGTDYTDTHTISITINPLVLPAGYSLEPSGTANLVYSYNAYGRTNNDAGKETYHYDYDALTGQTIEWTGAFNGFNWSGDGYVDGQTLTISGGATHTVNVPIFQNTYNGITLENSQGVENITQNGRTIEIEYEVASATDLNDVIIDFMADVTTTTENGVIYTGGTGVQVTPQSCYLLKSGSTINRDNTGFIINESDIAAAYLTPGQRIHLAFVIEPWSEDLAYDQSYHQSVNIYVNGEFANACPYVQGTDNFASTATLRIGSSSCIIKLYQIKMYNRGLTHKEILQNYKVAPAATRDKLTRLYDNDILNADGYVDYEKARTKYTCLLLTGPEPIYTETTGGETVLSNPTVSPYKGYPSPAGRKNKKTNKTEKKTESGVTLTKANPNVQQGYDVEFDLRDVIPTDQNIPVDAYLGARGAYVSSNNVQGTSSQKYPVHNLKVYLAKWQAPKTNVTWVDLEENEEVPEGTETRTVTKKQVETDGGEYEWVIVEDGEDTTGLTTEEVTQKKVETITPGEIKKVKYALKGKDEHGDDIGYAESTLCWKADYMSTDHANTFNANIADGLFSDTLPGASWDSKHQNTVYGIRCLLFQKQGNNPPEFLGDGCLNNDKGNNKTYDLERDGDKDDNTASQKWEFTNNSDDLGYFKTDTVFRTVGEGANAHIQALDAFESTYPDQGDLDDAGKVPNYNHLQVLLTWLSKRANYWDETDPTTRATKKQIFIDEFEDHINMDHALTYYIFSEYIALCDNRVKNMFLRSDNVKSETVYKLSDGQAIFEGNSNPNADFFKAIDTIDTGTTQQVAVEDPETHEISYETQPVYRYELHNRDDIDWANSTFAIWAPVLYDLDSCFGVENVGYIRVRYDAGWDYTWNNAPQFNGYESRLWLQFADCFDSEIKAAALTLYNRADGLNYTNFYRQQITGNLQNISPALSNQDMLVKFDKPWSEGFINYSLAEPAKETPYYKYLQRGSRTAQKTQFMNMRSKLLSSKYGATEFTNDSIKFRTGVPVGQTNLQDTKITVIANQVMYPGVAYGDNKDPTRATANGGKVNAGQSCDIYANSAVQGNDGIFICGASALTDIGDLSAFRPYQLDVGAGVNLKRLIVGSNASGYTNSNTDNFQNLNKCVLLEEMNVRNCTNVATLDLSNNALIKRVYAGGSGATTIIFPNGGVLTTVEYSAVTGNITILNQKGLTNFSYEGSETNHYASLTKLWIENTPNVPVVDIITNAMSHLTNGVRLVGLDLDLGDDPAFLEVLASEEYARGKYISDTGTFVAGNTNYPYITGKVKINSIRASLLTKINTLYPNLVVYKSFDGSGNPVNTIVNEYTINYYNYDGTTLLYTDYRTGQEYYIDPVYDTNPITHMKYISMPTKPQDAQYQYRFGTYDGNDYIRFSGWVKRYTTTNPTDDEKVSGNTDFIADYPTKTIQQYTVAWYEEEGGTPIRSYTANYGVDISTYTQPEETNDFIKAKSTYNGYKVFKGWDRPIGKLTENTNIYAQWETSPIDNGTQVADFDFEHMTAADIYALSQVEPPARRRLLENNLGNVPITITMGHDFDYTAGVNTVNLLGSSSKYVFNSNAAEAKIFDGSGALPEVRPLSINRDFTIALDFKLLLNATVYAKSREYVLASCYLQDDNSNTIVGFKVSLNKSTDASSAAQPITVTWGTQSTTIDYITIDTNASDAKQYCKAYRNVLVLRHSESTPADLKVYYIAPAAAAENFGTTVTTTTLTWAANEPINTPLILGGNYEGTTTSIENNRITRCPAKGVLYYGKYWDKDLGEKNCLALASWPHEQMHFYLSGYNNNESPTRQIIDGTSLSFVAAQAVGDRFIYIKNTSLPSDYGWSNSDVRNFCNNRIYSGMPTAYQSIIRNTTVISNFEVANGSPRIQPRSTNDYLYLPAEREVNTANINSSSVKYDEANCTWPWLSTGNVVNVYGFVQNSTTTLEQKTVANVNSFRFRFNDYYIAPTAKIFQMSVNPYNNGGTWTLNNEQISVQPGDVWWLESDLKSGTTVILEAGAYMYISNADINEGIYVDLPTDTGGWKKSGVWELRTYTEAEGKTGAWWNYFVKVNTLGQIADPANLGAQQYGTNRIVCPEFSI